MHGEIERMRKKTAMV